MSTVSKALALTITVFLLSGPRVFAFYPGGAYPPGYSAYPPVLSQPLSILPPGYITLVVGPETFYYKNGIFYQKVVIDHQYVVVPPPVGAVVYAIPAGYQTMLLGGVPYYAYGGVFYKRVLEGYKVVEPPVIFGL